VILLFLFNLKLCFKTENLFGVQFGELEKCKFTQETFAPKSNFDAHSAPLIICCVFIYRFTFHCYFNK